MTNSKLTAPLLYALGYSIYINKFGISAACGWSASLAFLKRKFRKPLPVNDSASKTTIWNSGYFGPFSKAFYLPIKLNKYVISFIPCLKPTRNPFTVRFAVSQVEVSSFYGKTIRSITHVFDEVREYHPLFRNRYSASAIVLEPKVVGIGASCNHRSPYFVGSAHFTANAMPVFRISCVHI